MLDSSFSQTRSLNQSKNDLKSGKPKLVTPVQMQTLAKPVQKPMPTQAPQPKAQTGTFTFSVSKGNYPNQIKQALKERGNWTEVKEDQAITHADFYWKGVNFTFA
jgi:hypothetical protein